VNPRRFSVQLEELERLGHGSREYEIVET